MAKNKMDDLFGGIGDTLSDTMDGLKDIGGQDKGVPLAANPGKDLGTKLKAVKKENALKAEVEDKANEERELADSSAEARRLSRGRSRTMLTGGEGVDDEDLSVSRRTLMGS